MKDYICFIDKDTRAIAEASLVTDTDIELLPEVNFPHYFFNRLNAPTSGTGSGTKVLKQLLQYIDEVNIPLLCLARTYDSARISQHELEQFYMRHGFEPVNKAKYKHHVLIYRPKHGGTE